jgi:hypothetical protein
MKQEYLIPSINSEVFSKLHFFKNQGTCNIQTDLTDIGGGSAGLCGAGFDDNAAFCLDGSEDLSDALEGLVLDFTGGQSATIGNCISIDKGNCESGLLYICNISGISGSECVESLNCPDGSVIADCDDTSGCGVSLGTAVNQLQAAS